MSKENLENKAFGDWTVIKDTGERKVLCRCSCIDKTEKMVDRYTLLNGTSTNCGHTRYELTYDLTGKRFGKWHVLEYAGRRMWKCQCSCENKTIRVLESKALRNGTTKSCGCDKTNQFKDTMLNKYGDISTRKVGNPREDWQIKVVSDEKAFKEYLTKLGKPTVRQLSQLLSINETMILRYIHKYKSEELVNLMPIKSSIESEILNYIKSLQPNVRCKVSARNIIDNYELDMYFPDLNIAIEVDGTYWHSSLMKDYRYHQQKTFMANNRGIRLIHIFEYEWVNIEKREIIKKYLYNIFGDTQKIYARYTCIKELNKLEAKNFLTANHLMGYSACEKAIGVYTNKEELVGVLTLVKCRFQSSVQDTYEIARLSWRYDVRVIGGVPKLLTYIKNTYNISGLLTYVDISKFTGNGMAKAGFKVIKITQPNYVWIGRHNTDIKTRYQTTKENLIKQGLGDDTQTEDEIMHELGYFKIYDCGNLKMVYGMDSTENTEDNIKDVADSINNKIISPESKLKYNLTGKVFGHLTVIEYMGNQKWKCKCSCGRDGCLGETIVHSQHLRHGRTKSCGVGNKFVDLSGQKFNHWDVIEYLGDSMYKCKCDCDYGTVRAVHRYDLITGKSKCCGICSGNQFKDMTNQMFDTWEAVAYIGNQKWLCICTECGEEKIIDGRSLRRCTYSVCACRNK